MPNGAPLWEPPSEALLSDPAFLRAAASLGMTPEMLALHGHKFFVVGEVIVRQGDCAACRQDVVGYDPMRGEVVLEDQHDGCKVVAQGHNKIVGQGLRHLMNAVYGQSSAQQRIGFRGLTTSTNVMRLGTGVGATVDGTTTLIAQNATAPNTVSFTFDTPATSTYRVKATCTWNAGTIGAITVTEIGIFGSLWTGLGTVDDAGGGSSMWSRLSTTDAEFGSFTINTAVPLSIEYRVSIAFA